MFLSGIVAYICIIKIFLNPRLVIYNPQVKSLLPYTYIGQCSLLK